MIDTSAARAEVLRRIRGAIAPGSFPEPRSSVRGSRFQREYLRSASLDRDALLELV